MRQASVTVIVPALNEAGNLAATLDMTVMAIVPHFADFEMIVIDDGSTDGTGAVADALAAKDPRVRVVHHDRNRGLGYSFREGVQLAAKDIVGWLPGDSNGIFSQADLDRVLAAAGTADFVLLYLQKDARSRLRRGISRGFVMGMNLLFGLQLRYYNGANFFRADLVRQVVGSSDGYGLFSDLVVQLTRMGCRCVEVGVDNRDASGSSHALRWRNIVQVIRMVVRLVWDVRIRARHRAPAGAAGFAALAERRQTTLT